MKAIPNTRIETPTALGEHLDRIGAFPVSAVSVETEGPDPLLHGIRSIHIGNPAIQLEVTRSAIEPHILKKYFQGPSVKIFHDAKTASKYLMQLGGVAPQNIADTMLIEQVLENDFERSTLKSGLSRLSLRYLDTEPGEEPSGTRAIPVIYGVFLRQMERLKQTSMLETAAIESRAALAFASMELSGLPIDQEMWLRNAADNEAGYSDRVSRLSCILKLDPSGPEQEFEIKVRGALAARLGGIGDLKKEALLASGDEAARLFVELREYRSLKSASGVEFLRHVHPFDGRLHSEFTQLAAPSGRMSSSNPNIQGIPKTGAFRSCIHPKPGRAMITADYSACELRIMAEASGDPVFVKTFSDGGDLHSIVAKAVFGKNSSKTENPDLRAKAKIINFGLAYGMGPQGLAVQAGISVPDAEKLLKRYFGAFPKIRDYLEENSEAAMKRGYAVTLGGRRCTLPNTADLDQKRISELKRFCKNMPIQGTNADMIKTAMPLILDDLSSARIDASLINVVHDEILVETPASRAVETSDIVKSRMIKAGEKYIKKVPVVVECTIGRFWGDSGKTA